MKYKLARMFT
jgi:dynein heavy chain, axonemal